METDRREFIKGIGVAGLAAFASGAANRVEAKAAARSSKDGGTSWTEMFLDNVLLESTPGVSRRLHPAKKHLLNPVIRCERWCDGAYMQPYTTMYDEDEKLFKM